MVFNPQTDITKYHDHNLIKYFSSCFFENKDIDSIKNYLLEKDLSYFIEETDELERFIIINGYDPNHVRKHVSRFVDLKKQGNLVVCFGDWGVGHVPPSRDVHISILERVINAEDLHSISNSVSSRYKPALLFFTHMKFLREKLNIKFWVYDKNIFIMNNLFDYFIGYSIKYIIFDKFNHSEVFNSGYVTTIDLDGIVLRECEILLNNNNNMILILEVQDVIGNIEKFEFPFERQLVKRSLRCRCFEILFSVIVSSNLILTS